MKKILYICANSIDNWDIFAPDTNEDASQNTISLVLLHREQNLDHISVSQVWNLNENEKDTEGLNPQKTLSYQSFLEEIFSHDLSVVI